MTTKKSLPQNPSRLEDFTHYFDLSLAVNRKQRALAYEIRYRVYCEEFGYEPTAVFRNHQEVDDFDCQSIHCLVTHRQSYMPAGCVRVVMVEGSDKLPMEKHAEQSLDRSFIDSFSDRRETLCEISRLAVDCAFRRRRGEQNTRFGNIDSTGFSVRERRSFPVISLALILGAGAVADVLNRKNCFAIMEPSLPNMLKRAGMKFSRVGEVFEFRGARAAYYGNMDELIGHAPSELRQYFNTVRERFSEELQTVRQDAAATEPATDHPKSARVPESRNRHLWPPALPENSPRYLHRYFHDEQYG